MNDKVFFVDWALGLRKSYADLFRDVNLVTRIPTDFSSDNFYQLFTMLVTALSGNAELTLSQEPLNDANENCRNRQTSAFTSYWNPPLLVEMIALSTSKIGLFTSGTTGRPKLVQHQTETLTRSVRTSERHQADVWGLAYHPASFAGLQVFFQAICNSNPLIRLTGLGASTVHDAIRDEGVTHLSATPTWMRLICSDAIVHNHVLSITTGGEITDRSLIQQIKTTFPNAKFRNIYAATEYGSLLISDGDSFCVPVHLSDLIKVQDGTLTIHRSLLAESLRDQFQSEFYVTGDCVEIVSNEPLTLRFTARKNDWINVGGYKVNPHEIEQMLLAIEGVADARVFGRKNSVTGNIVCCEVVCSAAAVVTQADIRRRLEQQVPAYKIPRFVEFLETIDKTPSGKKNRTE